MSHQTEFVEAVDERTSQNVSLIQNVLKTFRNAIATATEEFERMTGKTGSNNFDGNLFALSEMGLCTALALSRRIQNAFSDLPLSVHPGSVLFSRGSEELRINHFYFRGTEDPSLVVCLLPGQFIEHGRKPQYKGEKIELLTYRAPTLARRFSYEIAILRGSATDIQDQLGLTYSELPKPALPAQ